MIRISALVAALLLVACDTTPPPAASDDTTAIAAAERQAVGDTDAALREAANASTTGTNEAADRSSR